MTASDLTSTLHYIKVALWLLDAMMAIGFIAVLFAVYSRKQ